MQEIQDQKVTMYMVTPISSACMLCKLTKIPIFEQKCAVMQVGHQVSLAIWQGIGIAVLLEVREILKKELHSMFVIFVAKVSAMYRIC